MYAVKRWLINHAGAIIGGVIAALVIKGCDLLYAIAVLLLDLQEFSAIKA